MIRNVFCLLLVAAFVLKSTVLNCAHSHPHEPAGHNSLVHFHFGCNHQGNHQRHHGCHAHHHEHAHHHGHQHHQQHDGPAGHDLNDEQDGSMPILSVGNDHDCDMIAFGGRVDLGLQSYSKSTSSECCGLKLVPPSLHQMMQHLRLRCEPNFAGSETNCPLGLYSCAHTALFLQILCLRI